MSQRDDLLIGRVTERLGVDPELQLDIAQELRAHLEDSAAEFRRAGQGSEQAAASAARALGDEAELGEQLWQANRGRIRIRGFLRWAARVTLVPAAIATVLVIALSVLWDFRVWDTALGYGLVEQPVPRRSFIECLLRRPDPLDQMPERHRFILVGDRSKETILERRKAVAERWPDNPVYFADYVASYLQDPKVREGLDTGDRAVVEETIGELEAGERLEPDNAYYSFLKAGILFDASCSEKMHSVPPENVPKHGPYVEISDRALFDRGLSAFRLAAAKPRYASHATDMYRLRLAIWPKPRYLLRKIWVEAILESRVTEHNMTQHSILRRLAKVTSAYSLQLAEEGYRDEAIRLARDAEIMATKMGGNAQTILDILVAIAVRYLTLGTLADVFEESGLHDQARKLRDQEDRLQNDITALRQEAIERAAQRRPHAAIIQASDTFREQNLEPMRTAEQAVAEQTALTLLLVGVVGMALLACASTGIDMVLRHRCGNGPKLLFVGWRRLGRICLLAIVLPIALYALYAHVSPFGGREYAVAYALERLVLEFTVVAASVFGLLVGLSYDAIRQRAEELGLATPAQLRLRDRPRFLGTGLLLALCGVAYLASWEFVAFRPTWKPYPGIPAEYAMMSGAWSRPGYGYGLAGLVGIYVLVWAVCGWVRVRRHRPGLAHFRRTLFRSAVPILAAAAIVIGILCALALRRAEGTAVSRMPGSEGVAVQDEIELSYLRHLRDRCARDHETLAKQSEWHPERPASRPAPQRSPASQKSGPPCVVPEDNNTAAKAATDLLPQ